MLTYETFQVGRTREHFTLDQLLALNHAFERDPYLYLSKERTIELADQNGLCQYEVYQWFTYELDKRKMPVKFGGCDCQFIIFMQCMHTFHKIGKLWWDVTLASRNTVKWEIFARVY